MAGLPTNSNLLEQQRMLAKQRADALLHFGQLFEQNQTLKQHQSGQSTEATAHWQQVLQLGFPSIKHEDWKYTPLERLLAHNFSFAPVAEVTAAQCDDLSLIKDAHRVVFIDGLYAPELSDRDCGPYQLTPATENTSFPAAIRSEVFASNRESGSATSAHSITRWETQRQTALSAAYQLR